MKVSNGEVSVPIPETPPNTSNQALDAAAATNASNLAQMRKEIAELEAQVMKGGSRPQVSVLSWDLSEMSATAQFAICAGGVLVCYLSTGVLQEGLIRIDLDNELAWYLTLCQFLAYFSFAGVQRLSRGAERRKTPFSYYALLGLLQVVTMGLSNLSVQVLNYPTQILFKSAKPVPTMLFGVAYHRRRYSPSDLLAGVLMVVGMFVYCVADAANFSHFNPRGIVWVVTAIVADAISGAVQEKVSAQHKAPPDEVVFFTHLTGIVYLLVICVGTKEMGEGATFTLEKPHVFAKIVAYSLAGYLGASFLKALLKSSGALATLATTTTRKVAALGLSAAVYPKPFGAPYIGGAVAFFAGVLLHSSAVKVRLRALAGGNTLMARLLQAEPRRRRAVKQFK